MKRKIWRVLNDPRGEITFYSVISDWKLWKENYSAFCALRAFFQKKQEKTNKSKQNIIFFRYKNTHYINARNNHSTSSNWFIPVTSFTLLHPYSYNDGRTASRECRSHADCEQQEEEFEPRSILERRPEPSKWWTCFNPIIASKFSKGMLFLVINDLLGGRILKNQKATTLSMAHFIKCSDETTLGQIDCFLFLFYHT